jgi:hypothetical protein
MWWNLTGLGVLAVAVIALLFMPIGTVDIRVDIPAPNGRDLPTISGDTIEALALVFSGLVVLAILAVIAWLMWRVVRHHRARS